ncbi:MAG: hypothetical protein JW774_09135 [Candidatus Aureabacteria bacterium]|nr:hypothetical protein [Candidatus Auribacterota bacterium]
MKSLIELPTQNSKSTTHNSFLVGLLLFLVIVISYSPSLKTGFLWDDKGSVQFNPYLLRVDVSTFFSNCEASLPHGNKEIYRPLRTLFLSLIRCFFGPDPMPFHAFNMLLHFLVCLMIYHYLRILFSRSTAFLTSLLFAIHPVHSESLNLIIGSADLLCLFFLLFALTANHMSGYRKTILTAIFLLFALFSKETAVIGLPLVWLDDFQQGKKNLKKILFNVRTFLYLGITFFYLFIRWSLTGKMTQLSHHGNTWLHHIDFALQGFLTYMRLFIWPRNLKLDYIFFPGPFWLTALVFFIVGTGIFWLYKKSPAASPFRYGLAWFFICYLPISNILPIKTVVSERLMYLPSLGLCLFFSALIEQWMARKKIQGRIFFFSLACVFSFLTHARNKEWNNEDVFWKLNLQRAPMSARAHANYAVRMMLQKDYKSAECLFETAVAYNPNEKAFRQGLERVRQEKNKLFSHE